MKAVHDILESHGIKKNVPPAGMLIILMELLAESHIAKATMASLDDRPNKRRGIDAEVALQFPASKALDYPLERPTTLLEAIDMLLFRQHQLEVKGEKTARESGDTKLADQFKIRIQCTEAMQLAVRELINEAGRDATSNALKLDGLPEDEADGD
jgi:hypothetical protein